ncbi:ABC transporter ATP-binding protein [Schaalia sp. 19OD2882]|uniref:ABC transporter ATP-binding protein n=1 Tax=Schaalia sp. 19OD2882 TaxID=2794089 RepID=UPI001C1EE5BE|nr:ABC transporter ATP-binding protein [Schaalia sp. 19OD2882]QWW19702.1 ABC transporter ATP-binding protein [Schaalia sp. 19OD2882]
MERNRNARSSAPTSPAPTTTPESVPALSVTGVRKTFGTTVAVDDVTLTVPSGQIVALLGKNGAGKTTLIDIALGLQRSTEGRVQLFGVTPREAIRRSCVGVVHQSGALLAEHTVEQCLRIFASTHSTKSDLTRIIEETHLTGLVKRPIRKLSGGEQQRVRLALALLPDPLLLVLDEPTAGMDATARREFWALMRAQANRGRTILFATHYLAEAEEFAQRTVIMKDGRIIADAPTDELRLASAGRHLRILIPERTRSEAASALALVPGAADLRVTWTRIHDDEVAVQVQGPETDEVARALLALHGAHDLEITASSLEDTFAQLTA